MNVLSGGTVYHLEKSALKKEEKKIGNKEKYTESMMASSVMCQRRDLAP